MVIRIKSANRERIIAALTILGVLVKYLKLKVNEPHGSHRLFDASMLRQELPSLAQILALLPALFLEFATLKPEIFSA